ncbi:MULTISPECIES: LacI family DNA-binding transcriptional regulator [Paenibacillus]|uniref:LacI family transcriptional regulator n=1 Tax=Paenibacillus radicis (ex Xue et al. 2023) TaxID=2972489 RepID=A0ABT1YT41_9BACL|nr:LacI family DNA-binding transcriptional regulator [Paenibacillus radicis (ex Xue et al. 2023)]MCR8636346.1 LacI family transcriptional regulator [Paenibacillus radicis (ex Xue et al. 2023)]
MKKTTIVDVAKSAGVSIGTVSKVLNNKDYVSVEVKKKVQDTIERLNYQVNANARSLKALKTNKIGVIVSDISNIYMMSLAKVIEDRVRSMNYHMLIMSHNEDVTTEREVLQLILEQRVDALILVPTGGNVDMIQSVINNKIPVVIVDRKVDGITSDIIVDDNYYGSYEAVSYLHSLGHRRIGVIHGTENISIGKERLEGALAAIDKLECSKDKSLIVAGKFKADEAYKATIELLLLPERPTAIYCCNNTMTVGMLKAIQEQGLKIPEEISVIAFGDSTQWELVQPPLTLITQSLLRIGVEAAAILKNRLIMTESFEPKQIVIRPELLIRGSCSRPQQ